MDLIACPWCWTAKIDAEDLTTHLKTCPRKPPTYVEGKPEDKPWLPPKRTSAKES